MCVVERMQITLGEFWRHLFVFLLNFSSISGAEEMISQGRSVILPTLLQWSLEASKNSESQAALQSFLGGVRLLCLYVSRQLPDDLECCSRTYRAALMSSKGIRKHLADKSSLLSEEDIQKEVGGLYLLGVIVDVIHTRRDLLSCTLDVSTWNDLATRGSQEVFSVLSSVLNREPQQIVASIQADDALYNASLLQCICWLMGLHYLASYSSNSDYSSILTNAIQLVNLIESDANNNSRGNKLLIAVIESITSITNPGLFPITSLSTSL